MVADAELMRRALAQGDTARRRTAPNPWVGAVVVRDGEIVGEGSTQPPGGAHAEIEALRNAGDRARGATVFTTLEPCSHQGRTGPCVAALAEAGVTRVVVALEDPDPQVSGQGIAQLRDRGLTVDVGVGADDAARSLAPYLVHRRLGRAFTVVKTAMSLDGRIAARDGSSQWITGAAVPGRRPRVARRLAGGRGRRRHRAGRPSEPHRPRRQPPVRHQPLRVLLDAHRTGPCRRPAVRPCARAHPGRHHRCRARRRPAGVARRRRQGAPVPPATTGAGVDLAATLEVLGGPRGAPGAGRRRRRAVAGRWSTPGSPIGSSPTSRPRCSGATAAPRSTSPAPTASPTRPAGVWSTSPGRYRRAPRLRASPTVAGRRGAG